MCPMWNRWNSTLLLGGTFFRSVTSIPHHGRSVELPYAQSPHTVDLQIISSIAVPHSPGQSHSAQSVFSLNIPPDKQTALLAPHGGYGIFVHIANQAVILKLETASSDTWVADSYFNCLDLSGTTHSQFYCHTGPTFSSNTEGGSCENNDVHFDVHYADYNGASGPMAILPIQIADNITVMQQIGIARNVVTLFGRDNITSGVLGLGYSSLTSSYEGTDIWATEECLVETTANLNESESSQLDQEQCNRQTYTSLSETLFSSNSTNTQNSTLSTMQKVFTLSLSRSTVGNLYGGSITFGGIPDFTSPYINATGPFAEVPNEPLRNDPSGELGYYVVPVEGIVLPVDAESSVQNNLTGTDHDEHELLRSTASMRRRKIANRHREGAIQRGSQHMNERTSMQAHEDNDGSRDITEASFISPNPQSKVLTLTTTPETSQFILDSSSPFSYLPHHLAKAYNSLFQPPAFRFYDGGPYFLNCSDLTYVPPLGLVIGGETFWHNIADLVVRAGQVDMNRQEEVCYSAVQEAVGTGSHVDRGERNGDEDTPSGHDGREEVEEQYYPEEVDARLLLGQPFLNNVLAVFDVGGGTIGLMSRVEYETSVEPE